MESVVRPGRVSLEPTATPKNIQSAKDNENCLILHPCYKCLAFSLVRAQRDLLTPLPIHLMYR